MTKEYIQTQSNEIPTICIKFSKHSADIVLDTWEINVQSWTSDEVLQLFECAIKTVEGIQDGKKGSEALGD